MRPPVRATVFAFAGWVAATIGIATTPVAVLGAESSASVNASFTPALRQIELSASNLPAGACEWRVETAGLSNVETGADVNEPGIIYLPPEEPATRNAAKAENVFFFNDLVESDGWDLVLEFPENVEGTWKLNGRFSPLGGAVREMVAIPTHELEPGENLLHLRTEPLAVPRMYFRRVLARERDTEPVRLKVDRPNWSGRVTLRHGAGIVAERRLTGPEPSRSSRTIPERWWEDRELVRESALAVGRSLLQSQVKRRGSLFEGGFHLVYDPVRQAPRMSHWMWAWGPSIHLLLELEKWPEAQARGLAAPFRAAAIAAGRRSLEFELTTPGHPARGLSTVRWEPSRATPLGWAEYLSTADSLFMAGWGWMSLYHATGERIYLERMRALVSAAQRLMSEYPVIPQDWIVERQRWTPHTLDESVFGTIGFRRLFEATRSPGIAAAGRRFLDSHLRHMGRESGLLMRAWMRDENKEIWDPDIKGHAWVMEGYLDAHRLSGEARYLELAQQLAAKVMDCQAPDGSWTFLFHQPKPGDLLDAKGTAIWAYLFYDLYRTSGDARHLAAARRALGWCLSQQYRGTDENLDGAILHESNMAYVRQRPMTVLYTTTFFGLALLEEIAVREPAGRAPTPPR